MRSLSVWPAAAGAASVRRGGGMRMPSAPASQMRYPSRRCIWWGSYITLILTHVMRCEHLPDSMRVTDSGRTLTSKLGLRLS